MRSIVIPKIYMLFKHKPLLIRKFTEEFNRLKGQLELVETVTPIEWADILNFDFLSTRQYLSKDIVHYANQLGKKSNPRRVLNLLETVLKINPEDKGAQKLKKEIENIDESTLKKEAIDSELEKKQLEKEKIQAEIEREEERVKAIERERLQREQLEKEEDEKTKEQLQKNEIENRKIAEQDKDIQAKAEQDRQAQMREEQREREAERVAEKEKSEREKAKLEEAIIWKRDEQKRIQKEAESLEEARGVSFQGKRGKLRINLQWNTTDDLDLHVYDPDENHIYFSEKKATCQNSIGELDVDANAGGPKTRAPQENIFWAKDAPEGVYRVEVNHYNCRELQNCPFVVTIIPELGSPQAFSGTVMGEKDTVDVATFSYNKNEGLKIINSISAKHST